MSKIVKNYIYNLIYQLVAVVVPLITAPYLARTLGAEVTGEFSYVQSLSAMICTFVLLGIFNYGCRQIAYVRDDLQQVSRVFFEIMTTRLILAVVGSVVYISIVLIQGRYLDLFTIYYLYMIAYFIDCTWLFVGMEEMKWPMIKNIVTKVILMVGIFIFVKSPEDIESYACIQVLSILIPNLLVYIQLKGCVVRPRLYLTNMKKNILGSLKLFIPSIATTLYLQCDKIMIELITSDSKEVSFYDYSEKLVMIPLTFITVLSTVMMPRVANEFKKGNTLTIQNLLNKSARFSLAFAFPMMFGLIAISDQLVFWYLGKEFYPTELSIVIIAPIIITNSMTGISGNQYFTATNQVSILMKSQFTAAILNIIINTVLIPKYGFVGAAIATLITCVTCATVQYKYLLRQVKMNSLARSSLQYFIVSATMYILLKVTTNEMESTIITTMIQILIGGVYYFIVCCFLKDSIMLEIVNVIKRKVKIN